MLNLQRIKSNSRNKSNHEKDTLESIKVNQFSKSPQSHYKEKGKYKNINDFKLQCKISETESICQYNDSDENIDKNKKVKMVEQRIFQLELNLERKCRKTVSILKKIKDQREIRMQNREQIINADIEVMGKSCRSLNRLRNMKSARSLNNSETVVQKSIKKDI